MRRSHRKSNQKNIYVIDSESALKEYVRFRAESVLEISCAASKVEEWSAFLDQNGLSAQLIKDSGEPFQGLIKLNSSNERQLYQDIDRSPKMIALDHITDPRNLGAIARSAAFFGFSKIIVPANRQVHLTQASVATSMGGFAMCDLVVVGSLGECLRELKAKGYLVVGCDQKGDETAKEASPQMVLVLGSEEKGLSSSVARSCDLKLKISGSEMQGLESLNVSVAAGILMNRFK